MNQKIKHKTIKDESNRLQIQNQISLKVDAHLLQRTISQINKNLSQNQKSSNLFNHRAIIHHQAGQNQQAIKDLNLAIESNHLNFMAYFNLFSVYNQAGHSLQAFDQLCCSLSCLYLFRAKSKKRQLDAQKSIIYSNNNIQAHVLKCLMFMQKKDKTNLKLALDQINITIQILSQYKQVDKCRKFAGLRDLIVRDMQKKELYQTIIHIKNNQSLKNTSKSDKTKTNIDENQKCCHRLKNSYKQQLNIKEQIHQRLIEFNLLFQQLIKNKEFEILSKIQTKYPFKKLNNFIFQLAKFQANYQQLTFNVDQSHQQNQQFQIIQISKKTINPQKLQNQFIKPLQNAYIEQKQQTSQHLRQYSSLNQQIATEQQQNGLQVAHQQIQFLQKYEYNSNSEEEDQKKIFQKKQNKIEQFDEEEDERQRKNLSQEFIDTHNMYIEDISSLKNSQNNKRRNPYAKNSLDFSMKSSDNSSMCESNQVINFYKNTDKVGKRKKLQFKIQNFLKTDNFSSNKKSKKYLYCLGQYNNQNKEKNQFKTSCQKLQEGHCLWDQIYPPVKLTKNPQFFKIHVYSKNYFSQFDEFVGSGQKQVTMTGQNQIQIVNPNLQIVGILSIKVYLI